MKKTLLLLITLSFIALYSCAQVFEGDGIFIREGGEFRLGDSAVNSIYSGTLVNDEYVIEYVDENAGTWDTVNTIATRYDVDSLANGVYEAIDNIEVGGIDTINTIATRYDVDSLAEGVYEEIGNIEIPTIDTTDVLATKYDLDSLSTFDTINAGPYKLFYNASNEVLKIARGSNEFIIYVTDTHKSIGGDMTPYIQFNESPTSTSIIDNEGTITWDGIWLKSGADTMAWLSEVRDMIDENIGDTVNTIATRYDIDTLADGVYGAIDNIEAGGGQNMSYQQNNGVLYEDGDSISSSPNMTYDPAQRKLFVDYTLQVGNSLSYLSPMVANGESSLANKMGTYNTYTGNAKIMAVYNAAAQILYMKPDTLVNDRMTVFKDIVYLKCLNSPSAIGNLYLDSTTFAVNVDSMTPQASRYLLVKNIPGPIQRLRDTKDGEPAFYYPDGSKKYKLEGLPSEKESALIAGDEIGIVHNAWDRIWIYLLFSLLSLVLANQIRIEIKFKRCKK